MTSSIYKFNNNYTNLTCPSTETVITITGDMQFAKSESYLYSGKEKVAVDDIIKMTNLLIRLMMDISNDPELSKKFPYITEMANEYLIDKLTR